MTGSNIPDLHPGTSRVRAVITTRWGKSGYRPIPIPRIEEYYVDTALDSDTDTWTVDIGDPNGQYLEMLARDSEVRAQLFGVGLQGTTPILTGIVDEITYDEEGTFTLTGRDLSCIAVDSTVPPQQFRHQQPWKIVQNQAHEIGFKQVNLARKGIVKKLSVTDGSESYWEFWYRLYRREKMWIWTEPNGLLSAQPLSFEAQPSYFFGSPRATDGARIRQLYIPVERCEIRKSTQQRIAEVWVYGHKGDNGLFAISKDPTMKGWLKRPRKIMLDTDANSNKSLQKTGWDEIFEGKVGSREIKVTIPDPGFVIRQNRTAVLHIPEIGFGGEFFIVGTRIQGGSAGFVQEIRMREKQFATSRRIPKEPKIVDTEPTRSDVNTELATSLASVANMPNVWSDYFLAAAKKWHGPWDFTLFLATLIAICDQETGGTFSNIRANGGPGGSHIEWYPWNPVAGGPENLPSGGRDPKSGSRDTQGRNRQEWEQVFANEPGDYTGATFAVGPMQLYSLGYKHWADDLFKAGNRDQYAGGRWHPQWNIMAGAHALRDKLQIGTRDSGRDIDMWTGVSYYGHHYADETPQTVPTRYAVSVKNKVYNEPGYLEGVKGAVTTAREAADAANDQPFTDTPSGEKSPNKKYTMPLSFPADLSKSEFAYPDAEGAPDKFGRRYHAAKDWFATPGSSIVSPSTGKLVEIFHTDDTVGQVYGGVVKVQQVNGNVWVFRHVRPLENLSVGQRINEGAPIAQVERWSDNPASSHTHIEFWLTLAGGYKYENMRDPTLILTQ